MAVGDRVNASTLNSWYNQINIIVNRFGVSSTLSTINSGTPLDDAHINNMSSSLDTMKQNAYLSTVPSMFTTYGYNSVTAGDLVQWAVADKYTNTLNLLNNTAKFKNTSSYNNGNKNNGDRSHGTCTNGTHYNGGNDNNGNGWDNQPNVTKSNGGKHNHGVRNHGVCGTNGKHGNEKHSNSSGYNISCQQVVTK